MPNQNQDLHRNVRATLEADTTPSADLVLNALAGVPRRGVEQSVE